ncbi:TPA: hypothetical protein ACX6PV_000841 [Photobacterium damselae]
MSFKNFLKEKLNEKECSRIECIAKINLYHEEFRNLDSVTFSRWANGKTIPSLYKQVLLCNFFGYDLMEFIKNRHYSLSSKGKKIEYIYEKAMNEINNSIHNISYNYTRNMSASFNIKKYTKEEYRESFYNFYCNFDTYLSLFKKIDENSILPVSLTFEKYKNDHIVSHESISFITKENKNLFLSFFNVEIKDIEDFWFVNIGYHVSRNFFSISFTTFIYFFYQQKVEHYLSLIRGTKAFYDHIEIGYEQVGASLLDHGEYLYLTRCNLLKVISHPFVIDEMSKILNQYDIDSFFSQEIKDEYFKR